jgi:mandelate racemase
MTHPKLTIRDLSLRAVQVPLARPLITRVVTLESASLLRDIAELTRGERAAPVELYGKLSKAFTLLGHQGLTAMAISGFDMACWDALAQAAGLPLATLLGGRPQDVPAYNSNGLGLIEPQAAAEQAKELLAEGGFQAVKIRLGRPSLAEDLAALRAVRDAVGEDILLPSDFNQGLSVVEAIRRGRALDSEGLYWIEEPIAYDDLAGTAKIAREVATPIQIGENFFGPRAMAEAIAAQAADYVMPDVGRIGGVTGWLRAAALAEGAGLEMSSHLYPEISCHLLAVTPTRHWLEYVDWARPILADPPAVQAGQLRAPERPGTGIAWDEAAVAKYAVEL